MRLRALPTDWDAATRLRRVLTDLKSNQRGPGLAKLAGFSARQFHRVSWVTLGESPAAFRRRLRLDDAARQILTTSATILRIALEAGFESHESFSRAFRRRFGLAPADFRRTRGRSLPGPVRLGFALALFPCHAKAI